MTINPSTGAVIYKVPRTGASSFSYAVVASNAAGQAGSLKVSVRVSWAARSRVVTVQRLGDEAAPPYAFTARAEWPRSREDSRIAAEEPA